MCLLFAEASARGGALGEAGAGLGWAGLVRWVGAKDLVAKVELVASDCHPLQAPYCTTNKLKKKIASKPSGGGRSAGRGMRGAVLGALQAGAAARLAHGAQ